MRDQIAAALAELKNGPEWTQTYCARLGALLEERRKHKLQVGDMPNWAEVEVPPPERVQQLSLGEKVTRFLLEGACDEYGWDASAALYGAAYVLAVKGLDDAEVLATLMHYAGDVVKRHVGSDDTGAGVSWLWRYTVGEQCEKARRRLDPEFVFAPLEPTPEPARALTQSEAPAPVPAPAPTNGAHAGLTGLLGLVPRLLEAPTDERRNEMVSSLLDAAIREKLAPLDQETLLVKIQEQTGGTISVLRAQLKSQKEGLARRLSGERVSTEAMRAQARYVLIDSLNSHLFDRQVGRLIPKQSFRDAHDSETVEGAFSGGELPGTLTRCSRLTYVPGAGEFIDAPDGTVHYNVHRVSNAHYDLMDVSPWLRQFELMGMAPEDREHVLDWMAWVLQNQGRRVRHALVVGGPQGVGKDTALVAPMRYALGPRNVSMPGAQQVLGQFNAWAVDTQLVVIQEAEFGTRSEARQIGHMLKPLITEDELMARKMYTDPYMVPNMANLMLMTNSRLPVSIEMSDRRYHMSWCEASDPVAAREHAGDVLWPWFESGGLAGAYGFLLGRNVSAFDPNRAPPSSSWKRHATEDSLGELAAGMLDLCERRLGPFARDVVEWNQLMAALKTPTVLVSPDSKTPVMLPDKVTRGMVSRALDELGWTKKRAQVRVGLRDPTRFTLVVVRNPEKWLHSGITGKMLATEASVVV